MTTAARIKLRTKEGPMPSYKAFPNAAARGGLLVIHEAVGLTPHIESVVRRLADVGWYTLAPAFFHRSGSPVFGYDEASLAEARKVMSGLTSDGWSSDLDEGLGYLQRAGFAPRQIAVVGFWLGGSATFYLAAQRELGAAVSFYGGGILEDRYGLPALVALAPELQTPWLGLYGDLDANTPHGQLEDLGRAAQGARVPIEIVRYPQVNSGFNCDDRAQVFEPFAAADAWNRTLAWLDCHVSL